MKKQILTLVLLVAMSISSLATVYTRVTKFDKIGTNFCDTFLICCEYANNLYIFDSYSDASGDRSYQLIENFSGTQVTKNLSTCECIIEHTQWHSYDKLCNIRCFGDGDRASKGGYYLAGVGGGNGITYSDGEANVEIVWQGEYGIDITTKSGAGNFQFNTSDKGFKFYKNCGQTRPVLYVKGNGEGYVGEDESVNILDINYAQADLYSNGSDYSKNIYYWDVRLLQDSTEEAIPEVDIELYTSTRTSLKGDYKVTNSAQAGYIYKSNSRSPKIYFPSSAEEGYSSANIEEITFALTPVSRYDEKWYNYHIELYCIDSNKKRWKLDKVLPIFCTFTDKDKDTGEDLETDYGWVMEEKVATAIQMVTMNDLQLFTTNGTIYGADNMQIFTVTGLDVTAQNGQLNGIYIVKVGEKTAKVVVK